MLHSSRQNPPRLPLGRVNSHNSLAVASAFLASSPLPSPSLPSILPRHGKKPPKLNSRKILRLLTWLTVCILFFWAASRIVQSDQSLSTINYASPKGQTYQVVGDGLPDEPLPVIVTDQRGRSKWSISIPPTLDFPLKPAQYGNICDKSMEISQQVANLKKPDSEMAHVHKAHHGYYYNDPHFMDIAEAESHGIFPGLSSRNPLAQMQGPSSGETSLKPCARSLTYSLETSSAGLGHTLLTLWLAYGLAQREKRAFFIDDTNWPYGSYSTYFKPPPSPGCLSPPKTQIVPCPHQARHLLVNAATTRHSFGHMFMEYFEDGKKMGVMRQHTIFGMMRAGYEALFEGKLNDDDAAYLNERIAELGSSIREKGGEEIGVHVRHGDRHPLEFQYQKSYIPLEKYLDTAHNLTTTHFGTLSSSRILIASDDPDIYVDPLVSSSSTDPILLDIERAQSHISLASKKTLAASGKVGLGWEGGFFKDIFWALGLPLNEQIPQVPPGSPQPSKRQQSQHASTHIKQSKGDENGSNDVLDSHIHPTPAALKLRELVGRAYLLDLAVLGKTDRVVCAVSSYGCRILAVMMGWERGIVQGGWVNVDGSFEWRGVDW